LSKASFLEADSALGEPEVASHFFDKDLLGGVGGFMLGQEGGFERIVGLLAFTGDDDAAGSEAVLESVLARDFLAFGGLWTAEVIRVCGVNEWTLVCDN
jgi:hypothetical protein